MTLRAEQTALSLEDLRLVAAVGHAGSLAGAARRIAVNHASAWRRLGALEQRLGVRLFERRRPRRCLAYSRLFSRNSATLIRASSLRS
ncbi:MAG: LysR family transcriptional regulator [Gammaproteobacteria bacterium]|nr:MAG: LysR family transcriptional regulator [Gammaproteobacteria bacterium]